MSHADAMPDSITPDWHVYCEATCQPEDVYYEGSEDEDYDDPITRKRSYEAAGRRYLDGNVPLLLSAALRGPFDKESGWINPWRSKSRSSNAPRSLLASCHLAARQHNRGRTSAAALGEQPAETQDSLECHLPSPESLKQAPCTEQHPYLEGNELAAVHNWRIEIPPPALVKDGVWAVSPLLTTSKKRRASQPSWLKTTASKRRRTELMEEGSINTPLPRRIRTRLDLSNSNSSNAHISTNESFNSAPDCLNSSTRKSDHIRSEAREMDDDDELVCAPEMSFSSAPARLVSPSKRLSPRRRSHRTKHSIDELSQDKMAAASLSSPVSQRARLRAPSQPQASGAQVKANQGITATKSPAHGRITGSSSPLSRARTSLSSLSDMAMVDAEDGTSSEEELQNFETQDDQSFRFKVLKTKESHLEPTAELDPAPASQENNDCTDTESASSLSTDSSTDEKTDDVETINGHESQQSIADRHHILDEPTGIVSPESSASDATSQLDGTTFVQFTQAAMDAIIDQAVPQISLKAAQCEAAASKCEAVFGEDSHESHVQSESIVRDGEMFGQQTIVETKAIDEYSETDSEGDEIDHFKKSGDGQDCVGAIEAENCSPGSSTSGRASLPGNKTVPQNAENCSPSSSTSGRTSLSDNDTVSQNAEVLECATPSETQQPRRSAIDATAGNKEDAIIETPGASQDRGLAEFSPKGVLGRYVTPLRRLSGLGVHSSQYSQQDLITSQVPNVDAAERLCHSNMAMSFNKEPSQHDSDETSIDTDSESNITDSEGDIRSLSGHDPDSSSVPSPAHSSSTTADVVAHEVTEVSRNSPTAETPQKAISSLSQQSPWVQSQFPGQAMIPVLPGEQIQASTPEKAGDSAISITANAQSPWTAEAENILMEGNHAVPSLDSVDNASSSLGSQGRTAQPSPEKATGHPSQPSKQSGSARPSTPEPEFAFTSFASFATPSPQRSRCNKPSSWRDSGCRLPSTQGILASAMKNPWGRFTSYRRVSWAPLPHEQGKNCASPGLSTTSSPCRERAASPPPTTPLSELPTPEDSKFHNHFAAVANRTDAVRKQRLLPTASQQTLYSPEPHAMADQFLAADDIGNSEAMNDMPVEDGPEVPGAEPDPMDIVEDMFNEMGDFLQTWDVDAELDEARKADKTLRGSTRLGIEAQSPW